MADKKETDRESVGSCSQEGDLKPLHTDDGTNFVADNGTNFVLFLHLVLIFVGCGSGLSKRILKTLILADFLIYRQSTALSNLEETHFLDYCFSKLHIFNKYNSTSANDGGRNTRQNYIKKQRNQKTSKLGQW